MNRGGGVYRSWLEAWSRKIKETVELNERGGGQRLLRYFHRAESQASEEGITLGRADAIREYCRVER